MAARGNGDALFALKWWKPISWKEAERINGWYARQILASLPDRPGRWYACRKLNQKTNLCRVHAHKPGVCSRFPFYGKEGLPENFLFFTKSCGYIQAPIQGDPDAIPKEAANG